MKSKHVLIPNGTVFGQLTVLSRERVANRWEYACKCSCNGPNALRFVISTQLRNGRVDRCEDCMVLRRKERMAANHADRQEASKRAAQVAKSKVNGVMSLNVGLKVRRKKTETIPTIDDFNTITEDED